MKYKIPVIILGVFIAIGYFLLFFQKKFDVSVSREFNNHPKILYQSFEDLKLLQSWIPWNKNDTTMTDSISFPSNSVGAVYKWKGDKQKAGTGKIVLTEKKNLKKIQYHLFFHEEADPVILSVVLNFNKDSTKTHADWYMSGSTNFLASFRVEEFVTSSLNLALDSLESRIASTPSKSLGNGNNEDSNQFND